MRRKNEPQEIRNCMRPPNHSRAHSRIGNQVCQRPRRLRLVPATIPGHCHRLEQPIYDSPPTGPDDSGPTGRISGGNVGEQSRNPKLEARADLMVGGGQDRPQRLPQNRGGHTGLFNVMEKVLEGVAVLLYGVLGAGVQWIGGFVFGVVVGGEKGVGGDESGNEGSGDGEDRIAREGACGERREMVGVVVTVENRRLWDLLGIDKRVRGLSGVLEWRSGML